MRKEKQPENPRYYAFYVRGDAVATCRLTKDSPKDGLDAPIEDLENVHHCVVTAHEISEAAYRDLQPVRNL